MFFGCGFLSLSSPLLARPFTPALAIFTDPLFCDAFACRVIGTPQFYLDLKSIFATLERFA
jgi:hypothetical protein